MALLNALQMVTSQKTLKASPIVNKRNKLVARIHEQLEMLVQDWRHCTQRLPAMTNPVLHPRTKLRQTLIEIRWDKDRVISKTLVSRWFK